MSGINARSQEGGAYMYRMYGIPQGAREGGAVMSMDERYVAVPWMARSDACPWMNGIPQGAREGGAIVTR